MVGEVRHSYSLWQRLVSSVCLVVFIATSVGFSNNANAQLAAPKPTPTVVASSNELGAYVALESIGSMCRNEVAGSPYESLVANIFPFSSLEDVPTKNLSTDALDDAVGLEHLKQDSIQTYINQTIHAWRSLEQSILGHSVYPDTFLNSWKNGNATQGLLVSQNQKLPEHSLKTSKDVLQEIAVFNLIVEKLNNTCANRHDEFSQLKKILGNKLLQDQELHPEFQDLIYPNGKPAFDTIGDVASKVRARMKETRQLGAEESSLYWNLLSHTRIGKLMQSSTDLHKHVGSWNPFSCVENRQQFKTLPNDLPKFTLLTTQSLDVVRKTYRQTLASLIEDRKEKADAVLKKYIQTSPYAVAQTLLANPITTRAHQACALILDIKDSQEMKSEVMAWMTPLLAVFTGGLASLSAGAEGAMVFTSVAAAMNGLWMYSTVSDLYTSVQMEKWLKYALVSQQIEASEGIILLQNIQASYPMSFLNLALAGVGVAATSVKAASILRLKSYQRYLNAHGGATSKAWAKLPQSKPTPKVDGRSSNPAAEQMGVRFTKPTPPSEPKISASTLDDLLNWVNRKNTPPQSPSSGGRGSGAAVADKVKVTTSRPAIVRETAPSPGPSNSLSHQQLQAEAAKQVQQVFEPLQQIKLLPVVLDPTPMDIERILKQNIDLTPMKNVGDPVQASELTWREDSLKQVQLEQEAMQVLSGAMAFKAEHTSFICNWAKFGSGALQSKAAEFVSKRGINCDSFKSSSNHPLYNLTISENAFPHQQDFSLLTILRKVASMHSLVITDQDKETYDWLNKNKRTIREALRWYNNHASKKHKSTIQFLTTYIDIQIINILLKQGGPEKLRDYFGGRALEFEELSVIKKYPRINGREAYLAYYRVFGRSNGYNSHMNWTPIYRFQPATMNPEFKSLGHTQSQRWREFTRVHPHHLTAQEASSEVRLFNPEMTGGLDPKVVFERLQHLPNSMALEVFNDLLFNTQHRPIKLEESYHVIRNVYGVHRGWPAQINWHEFGRSPLTAIRAFTGDDDIYFENKRETVVEKLQASLQIMVSKIAEDSKSNTPNVSSIISNEMARQAYDHFKSVIHFDRLSVDQQNKINQALIFTYQNNQKLRTRQAEESRSSIDEFILSDATFRQYLIQEFKLDPRTANNLTKELADAGVFGDILLQNISQQSQLEKHQQEATRRKVESLIKHAVKKNSQIAQAHYSKKNSKLTSQQFETLREIFEELGFTTWMSVPDQALQVLYYIHKLPDSHEKNRLILSVLPDYLLKIATNKTITRDRTLDMSMELAGDEAKLLGDELIQQEPSRYLKGGDLKIAELELQLSQVGSARRHAVEAVLGMRVYNESYLPEIEKISSEFTRHGFLARIWLNANRSSIHGYSKTPEDLNQLFLKLLVTSNQIKGLTQAYQSGTLESYIEKYASQKNVQTLQGEFSEFFKMWGQIRSYSSYEQAYIILERYGRLDGKKWLDTKVLKAVLPLMGKSLNVAWKEFSELNISNAVSLIGKSTDIHQPYPEYDGTRIPMTKPWDVNPVEELKTNAKDATKRGTREKFDRFLESLGQNQQTNWRRFQQKLYVAHLLESERQDLFDVLAYLKFVVFAPSSIFTPSDKQYALTTFQRYLAIYHFAPTERNAHDNVYQLTELLTSIYGGIIDVNPGLSFDREYDLVKLSSAILLYSDLILKLDFGADDVLENSSYEEKIKYLVRFADHYDPTGTIKRGAIRILENVYLKRNAYLLKSLWKEYMTSAYIDPMEALKKFLIRKSELINLKQAERYFHSFMNSEHADVVKTFIYLAQNDDELMRTAYLVHLLNRVDQSPHHVRNRIVALINSIKAKTNDPEARLFFANVIREMAALNILGSDDDDVDLLEDAKGNETINPKRAMAAQVVFKPGYPNIFFGDPEIEKIIVEMSKDSSEPDLQLKAIAWLEAHPEVEAQDAHSSQSKRVENRMNDIVASVEAHPADPSEIFDYFSNQLSHNKNVKEERRGRVTYTAYNQREIFDFFASIYGLDLENRLPHHLRTIFFQFLWYIHIHEEEKHLNLAALIMWIDQNVLPSLNHESMMPSNLHNDVTRLAKSGILGLSEEELQWKRIARNLIHRKMIKSAVSSKDLPGTIQAVIRFYKEGDATEKKLASAWLTENRIPLPIMRSTDPESVVYMAEKVLAGVSIYDINSRIIREVIVQISQNVAHPDAELAQKWLEDHPTSVSERIEKLYKTVSIEKPAVLSADISHLLSIDSKSWTYEKNKAAVRNWNFYARGPLDLFQKTVGAECWNSIKSGGGSLNIPLINDDYNSYRDVYRLCGQFFGWKNYTELSLHVKKRRSEGEMFDAKYWYLYFIDSKTLEEIRRKEREKKERAELRAAENENNKDMRDEWLSEALREMEGVSIESAKQYLDRELTSEQQVHFKAFKSAINFKSFPGNQEKLYKLLYMIHSRTQRNCENGSCNISDKDMEIIRHFLRKFQKVSEVKNDRWTPYLVSSGIVGSTSDGLSSSKNEKAKLQKLKDFYMGRTGHIGSSNRYEIIDMLQEYEANKIQLLGLLRAEPSYVDLICLYALMPGNVGTVAKLLLQDASAVCLKPGTSESTPAAHISENKTTTTLTVADLQLISKVNPGEFKAFVAAVELLRNPSSGIVKAEHIPYILYLQSFDNPLQGKAMLWSDKVSQRNLEIKHAADILKASSSDGVMPITMEDYLWIREFSKLDFDLGYQARKWMIQHERFVEENNLNELYQSTAGKAEQKSGLLYLYNLLMNSTTIKKTQVEDWLKHIEPNVKLWEGLLSQLGQQQPWQLAELQRLATHIHLIPKGSHEKLKALVALKIYLEKAYDYQDPQEGYVHQMAKIGMLGVSEESPDLRRIQNNEPDSWRYKLTRMINHHIPFELSEEVLVEMDKIYRNSDDKYWGALYQWLEEKWVHLNTDFYIPIEIHVEDIIAHKNGPDPTPGQLFLIQLLAERPSASPEDSITKERAERWLKKRATSPSSMVEVVDPKIASEYAKRVYQMLGASMTNAAEVSAIAANSIDPTLPAQDRANAQAFLDLIQPESDRQTVATAIADILAEYAGRVSYSKSFDMLGSKFTVSVDPNGGLRIDEVVQSTGVKFSFTAGYQKDALDAIATINSRLNVFYEGKVVTSQLLDEELIYEQMFNYFKRLQEYKVKGFREVWTPEGSVDSARKFENYQANRSLNTSNEGAAEDVSVSKHYAAYGYQVSQVSESRYSDGKQYVAVVYEQKFLSMVERLFFTIPTPTPTSAGPVVVKDMSSSPVKLSPLHITPEEILDRRTPSSGLSVEMIQKIIELSKTHKHPYQNKARGFLVVNSVNGMYPEHLVQVPKNKEQPKNRTAFEAMLYELNELSVNKLSDDQILQIADSITNSYVFSEKKKLWTMNHKKKFTSGSTKMYLSPRKVISGLYVDFSFYLLWDEVGNPYFFVFDSEPKFSFKSKIIHLHELGKLSELISTESYYRSWDEVLDKEYFYYEMQDGEWTKVSFNKYVKGQKMTAATEFVTQVIDPILPIIEPVSAVSKNLEKDILSAGQFNVTEGYKISPQEIYNLPFVQAFYKIKESIIVQTNNGHPLDGSDEVLLEQVEASLKMADQFDGDLLKFARFLPTNKTIHLSEINDLSYKPTFIVGYVDDQYIDFDGRRAHRSSFTAHDVAHMMYRLQEFERLWNETVSYHPKENSEQVFSAKIEERKRHYVNLKNFVESLQDSKMQDAFTRLWFVLTYDSEAINRYFNYFEGKKFQPWNKNFFKYTSEEAWKVIVSFTMEASVEGNLGASSLTKDDYYRLVQHIQAHLYGKYDVRDEKDGPGERIYFSDGKGDVAKEVSVREKVQQIVDGRRSFEVNDDILYTMNQMLQENSETSGKIETWLREHVDPADSVGIALRNLAEPVLNDENLNETQGQYLAIQFLSQYAQGNFKDRSQAWLKQRQNLKFQVKEWLIQAAKDYKNNSTLKLRVKAFGNRQVTVKFKSKTIEVLESMKDLPEDFTFLFGFKQNENKTLTVNGTSFGLVKKHNGQIYHSRILGGKDLLEFMFEYLEDIQGRKISMISEVWRKNELPLLSRMYDEFKLAKAVGKSDLEAAATTWSGKMYAEEGFRAVRAEMLNLNGQPQVRAIFIRSQLVKSSAVDPAEAEVAARDFLSHPSVPPQILTSEAHAGLLAIYQNANHPDQALRTKAIRSLMIHSLRQDYPERLIEAYPPNEYGINLEHLVNFLTKINEFSSTKLSREQVEKLAKELSERVYFESGLTNHIGMERKTQASFDPIHLMMKTDMSVSLILDFIWDEAGNPYFFFTNKESYDYKSKIYPLRELVNYNKLIDLEGYKRTIDEVLGDKQYYMYMDLIPEDGELKFDRIDYNKYLRSIPTGKIVLEKAPVTVSLLEKNRIFTITASDLIHNETLSYAVNSYHREVLEYHGESDDLLKRVTQTIFGPVVARPNMLNISNSNFSTTQEAVQKYMNQNLPIEGVTFWGGARNYGRGFQKGADLSDVLTLLRLEAMNQAVKAAGYDPGIKSRIIFEDLGRRFMGDDTDDMRDRVKIYHDNLKQLIAVIAPSIVFETESQMITGRTVPQSVRRILNLNTSEPMNGTDHLFFNWPVKQKRSFTTI